MAEATKKSDPNEGVQTGNLRYTLNEDGLRNYTDQQPVKAKETPDSSK